MEVCFLASGERVTVFDPDDFAGKAARQVKQTLAACVGMTRFRLRLFAEGGDEIKDDEVFAPDTAKVNLVKLQLVQPDAEQRQEMIDAVELNDTDDLEVLLQQPLDPNVRIQVEGEEEPQSTLLHHAASCGHVEVMQLLLEARAQIDVLHTETGQTPLHLAAEFGTAEAVRLLLKAGASHHQIDDQGTTPLSDAAGGGHLDVVRLLLAEGANPEAEGALSTPMWTAAFGGHAEVVRHLLHAGANPNRAVFNGERPLWRAASQGHSEVVRALLEFGADGSITFNGSTPLDIASRRGHREVADLLSKHLQEAGERPRKVQRTD